MSAFEVLTPPNPDYRELIQSMRAPILLVIEDKGSFRWTRLVSCGSSTPCFDMN